MTVAGGATGEKFFQLVRSRWRTVPLVGLVPLALGVGMQVWPAVPQAAVGVVVGGYLVVAALAPVFGAASRAERLPDPWLTRTAAVLSIVLGAVLCAAGFYSTVALSAWIGVALLLRGGLRTAAAVDTAVPAPQSQALFGIAATATGIVLIACPMHSVAVLAVLAGYWLIALGILEIVTAGIGPPEHAVAPE
jgi:uncharacterized membrane protein HdeD (DUF308 family)